MHFVDNNQHYKINKQFKIKIMETTNQNTNPLKAIKESFETNTVKKNLDDALYEMKLICQQRDYIVEGSLDSLLYINLDNSTLSSRKKLSRKIYFFMKKQSRKTMSALLAFIRKRFLGEEYRVMIKPSLLEQEIIVLREQYKKMRLETEQTRISLKEKKKLLYEKNQKPF